MYMTNELALNIAWGLAIGIPSFLATWSFISNPQQFSEALQARIGYFAARIFIFIKVGFGITAGIAYVIFDPIMLFVDDILVVWAVAIFVKKSLNKAVFDAIKEEYPFPKPWRKRDR